MTKPKLPIKLGVEQSIAGEKDVNRLSCVRPELGEFATLFITLNVWCRGCHRTKSHSLLTLKTIDMTTEYSKN